jgi:hypothetical protein
MVADSALSGINQIPWVWHLDLILRPIDGLSESIAFPRG